ncbi:MAG: two pore domain potassium channel family protein [Chromatiales bacterium]|nr:MAG: two pore domain potassium channel family protein [Chromatiales bacterium]
MPRLKKEANFSYMLIGMLITLVIGPVLLEFGIERFGFSILLSLNITLIVGVWSIVDSRRWFWIGVSLAAFTIIVSSIDIIWPSFTAEVIGLTGIITFCFFSLVFTLTRLFQSPDRQITANRLIGAASVYLLLGLGFGVLNMLIALVLPGSYKGLTPGGDGSVGIDLIYYTFVSMTTLGYGDVVPIRPLAQAVAYMSAVAGQFYIAILVAGLVGAYVAQQLQGGQSK